MRKGGVRDGVGVCFVDQHGSLLRGKYIVTLYFDDKDTGLLNTLVISDFIDGMTTDAGDSGALVMLQRY